MPNPVFSCPRCGQLLGDIPQAGLLTVVCTACRLKYQVVRGRVCDVVARRMTLGHLERGKPDAYQYEIHLALSSGRVDTVSMELVEGDARIIARTGDILSAVYLMRGAAREQLLSVHSATTGHRLVIALPGEKATTKAWWFAGGVAVTTAVITTGLGVAGPIAFGVTALSFVGLGVGLGHRFMPRVAVSSSEEAQLTAAQRLLADKLDLEEARARTVREIEAKHELRERLQSLRSKMIAVGLELYAPRIAAVDSALTTIDRQTALYARLREGYERSIQMIEIELEAGATADAMDAAATEFIADTVAEMRALEEQQAELGRQLAANVEVEGLLRSVNS